jgi:hypothetical protein
MRQRSHRQIVLTKSRFRSVAFFIPNLSLPEYFATGVASAKLVGKLTGRVTNRCQTKQQVETRPARQLTIQNQGRCLFSGWSAATACKSNGTKKKVKGQGGEGGVLCVKCSRIFYSLRRNMDAEDRLNCPTRGEGDDSAFFFYFVSQDTIFHWHDEM